MTYSDLSVRRTIAMREFPRGVKVYTPTGRPAVIVGHYDDGRIELRYMDTESRGDDAIVALFGRHLVKA